MSGCTGASVVKSRKDFDTFVKEYTAFIKKLGIVENVAITGSYHNDLTKDVFGDIDLVIQATWSDDKRSLKQHLVEWFTSQSPEIIVPFTSDKHRGKRTYNAGELVSVRFYSRALGYSVQIDNIVSLSKDEFEFKQFFLNMPAPKQGLVLGLAKVAAIETAPEKLAEMLNITLPDIEDDQEFEFSLSSSELQLRVATYEPGSFTQVKKENIWQSHDIGHVYTLLHQYNLRLPFEELLTQAHDVLKNPRSRARVKGVFSSMVSVKSGEVGTPKATQKMQAIELVNQTLIEKSASRDLKLIPETITEAKLFRVSRRFSAFTGQEIADIFFLHNLALFILISTKKTSDAGRDYAVSTYQFGPYTLFRSFANDMYMMAYQILHPDNTHVRLENSLDSKRFLRSLSFDGRRHVRFLQILQDEQASDSTVMSYLQQLERQLKITDARYKTWRRSISTWASLTQPEQQRILRLISKEFDRIGKGILRTTDIAILLRKLSGDNSVNSSSISDTLDDWLSSSS